MNTKDLTIAGLILIVLLFGGLQLFKTGSVQLGGGQFTDTYTLFATNSTTTVNTTATRVFASGYNLARISNNTGSTLFCSADNTTAALSNSTSGAGIVIGPTNSSTSTIPSVATFGRCYAGAYNCIPVTGAINCVASAKVDVAITKD